MIEEPLWGDVREDLKCYCIVSRGKGKLREADCLAMASLPPASLTHLVQPLAKLIW